LPGLNFALSLESFQLQPSLLAESTPQQIATEQLRSGVSKALTSTRPTQPNLSYNLRKVIGGTQTSCKKI